MTLPDPFSTASPEARLVRAEERAALDVVRRDTGGLRVAVRPETVTETLAATTVATEVEVTRVPADRIVEAPEGPRTIRDDEGELTILPVYEERPVVTMRLHLVEEVHIRRRPATRELSLPVELRRETVEVTPLPAEESLSLSQSGVTGMLTDTTAGSRTVTALFDTSMEAERAVERLRRAGVPEGSIRVTAGAADYDQASYTGQNRGFWDSLSDFFFPDEDRYAYAEGLSRGAQLVTVTDIGSALHDQVVDILDDEGSIDLEARSSEWRSSGWRDYGDTDYYDADAYRRTHGTDYAVGGTAALAANRASEVVGGAVDTQPGGAGTRGTIYDDGVTDRGTDYQMAADASGSAFSGARVGSDYGTDRVGDEDTVRVVEERLDVGKREAEAGRVRVRSYVREVPVEADVELRATRVFLDRRPVDRPLTDGDVAFQDRTIEARESVEEAVVRKEARVVEEIGLRQETEARTEHVSDTVRRTEVEIEDERTGETQRITPDRDRL